MVTFVECHDHTRIGINSYREKSVADLKRNESSYGIIKKRETTVVSDKL